MPNRIDSGIAARMISVSRQLPRNSRIISAVSAAAMRPPILTLDSAALTKIDWSKIGLITTPRGMTLRMSVSAARTPVDHRQCRCPAGFTDREQCAPLAVHGDRVCLDLEAIVHVRDVAHENGLPGHLRHRKRVDVVDDARTVIHRELVVLAPDLHVAGRQYDILPLQGVADVLQGRARAPRALPSRYPP